MKENFDSIFNRFFGKKSDNKYFGGHMPDSFKKIIDDLTSGIDKTDEIKNKIKEDKEIRDKIENGGVDGEVEKGEFDGNEYTKETWETEYGSLTKITVNGPFDGKSPEDLINALFGKNGFIKSTLVDSESEKSLEEQLEEAIKKEDYELCAIIRDKITRKDILNNTDNQ